jgi:hypothetical protein
VRICKITQVRKFRGNAHARGRSTTADCALKLIRNQQVTRSSRVAGSNLLKHFRRQVIPGIRAFGTQLLCEQVIGRALRRQSYELNEDNLFDAEYADNPPRPGCGRAARR